jgi:MFS family permease
MKIGRLVKPPCFDGNIGMSSTSPTSPPSLLRDGVSTSIATIVACLCAFMVVMDGAIINVSLPAMQEALALSPVGLQWVVDIYLLLLGGFMLLAARVGDIYGRRAVLLWGLAFFTGASFAGGFATNGPMLLVSRAVQGFGASALATSPLAVIMAGHPKGTGRERAIGLWAACAAMGSAFGVVIGGVLTSLMGWRWVMSVNVPVGLILMAIVAACLNPRGERHARPKLDVPGAVTITLALGAFMFAISQSIHDGWDSFSVLTAFDVAAVALLAFIVAELRAPEPLIPFSIFRVRNIPIGMVMIAGLGAVLAASTFFLSQALQRVDGRSALDTGLALLPLALALAVAAMACRRLRDAGVRQLPSSAA